MTGKGKVDLKDRPDTRPVEIYMCSVVRAHPRQHGMQTTPGLTNLATGMMLGMGLQTLADSCSGPPSSPLHGDQAHAVRRLRSHKMHRGLLCSVDVLPISLENRTCKEV